MEQRKTGSRNPWNRKDGHALGACAAALGIMAGAEASEKYREPVQSAAFVVLLVTGVPLLGKALWHLGESLTFRGKQA